MAFELNATVNTWDVIYSVTNDDELLRDNYRGLLEFVFDVDESVADMQFTKALRDRLNLVIEMENE